jgi:hypothetical protein
MRLGVRETEYASANRNLRDNKVYGSLSTGGSRAVRETGVMVQQAGASARERLIAAAAKRWNVPGVGVRGCHEQGRPQADRAAHFAMVSWRSRRPRSSSTRSPRSRRPISSSSSAGGWRGSTCR